MLLMDFQKELKILRVTDFWQKKVTCGLNVLPPVRKGGVGEQHIFVFVFSKKDERKHHSLEFYLSGW